MNNHVKTFDEIVTQAVEIVKESKVNYEFLGDILALCKTARQEYDACMDSYFYTDDNTPEFLRGRSDLATGIMHLIKARLEKENGTT